MAVLLTCGLFLAGALVTALALRVQAHRRGRELKDAVRSGGATWGALGRVRSDGLFLDRGRTRRGGGPRGTLTADTEVLRWRPDKYETEHGDQPFAWRWAEVRCSERRPFRDVTGLAGEKVTLLLPQGRVRLVLFHQTGITPGPLRPQR